MAGLSDSSSQKDPEACSISSSVTSTPVKESGKASISISTKQDTKDIFTTEWLRKQKYREHFFWNWECQFYSYAAHKLMFDSDQKGDKDKHYCTPVPRCFWTGNKSNNAENSLSAKLIICPTQNDHKIKDLIDQHFTKDPFIIHAINGHIVEDKQYMEEIHNAKLHSVFYWNQNFFAFILHTCHKDYSSCEENVTELIFPFVPSLNEKNQNSFEDDLVSGRLPIFPFACLELSPPIYGTKISGINVNIIRLMLEIQRFDVKQYSDIDLFTGSSKRFLLDTYPNESNKDTAIKNCFLRSFEHVMGVLNPACSLSPADMQNIQFVIQACRTYKHHFKSCNL